ncbi:MAG: histidine phosphatase family protein [Hyphomicrobiaceae bacterium]
MPHPPLNVRLIFIRHGQTDWNRLGRLQGHIDVPLNEVGRAQAKRNGAVLAENWARLASGGTRGNGAAGGKDHGPSGAQDALAALPFVASPLSRAVETMELVRASAGLPRAGYSVDPRLKEVCYGHWEGAYLAELKQQDPQGYNQRRFDKFHWRPIDGESYADLTARVSQWLATIDRDHVVVSHGGVSRVIRGLFLDLAEDEIPNLEVPQDRIMVIERGSLVWL